MEYKFSGFEITTLMNDIDFIDHLFDNGKFIYTEEQLNEILKLNTAGSDESKKTELKLNFLYDYAQRISELKIQIDFIYSYLKLSTNIKRVPADYTLQKSNPNPVDYYYIEDFQYHSHQLSEYLLIVNSDIRILEDKVGKVYWKQFLFNRKKNKESVAYTAQQIQQKQILELILKTGETFLFEPNDVAIGEAVHWLTGKNFVAEQVRKSITGKGAKYKPSVYTEALEKIELIKDSILSQLKKISPDT